MAMHLCRRSFSTIIKCVNLLEAPQTAVTSKFLFDSKSITQAGFCTQPAPQRPRLGLRKQNLPPYPIMETIRSLDKLETFLPSHYKVVKHGDFEFLECAEGYVNVYVNGYLNSRDLDARAGYAVYFGPDHPLNSSGGIERRQSRNSSKMYAFLKAMQQIPENLIQKVCICVDEIPLITFIDKSLRNMSENSFRSVHTGKLNKDLETSMEMNKILRTRQDLTLRLKYVPNDIGVNGMYRAFKNAQAAAEQATREYRINKFARK